MTPQKTVTLSDDVQEQLTQRAEAEGKTADDLANELLGPLLEIRKQSEASDRRWQDLLSFGERQAEKLGIKESDVDRLIHEWRAEQRGR